MLDESDGTYQIVYAYDYDGTIIRFYYDANSGDSVSGADYFYLRNQQGDITTIIDNGGNTVVKYRYDAYGNILGLVDNSTGDIISKMNPYTYRGYRYDSEIGYYYLNSRYYNPEIGRFINADGIEYLGANEDILSYNLYAYCSNNPVMNVDPSGKIALALFLVGGFAIYAAIDIGTVFLQQHQFQYDDNGIEEIIRAVGESINGKIDKHFNVKNYTVYALQDSTGKVVYVGRTTNYEARIKTHELNPFRKGCVPVKIAENLSYSTARGLEQIYMMHYHSIDKMNPTMNQINGIRPQNPNIIDYFRDGLRYIYNSATDEALNIIEFIGGY